jgi:SAM-dependent methyltransferase
MVNPQGVIEKVKGSDEQAYAQREKGFSPDEIRDALWEILYREISGAVLDTGSGYGGWIQRMKALKAVNRFISVDIVDDGASQIEGVEFHISDLSVAPLPAKDDELDFIFAVEVVEHLANPRHFLQESARTLKVGGKLAVTTPCNETLRAKLYFAARGYFPMFADDPYHLAGHITPILEIDLKRMASEFGFSAVEFHYPVSGWMPLPGVRWKWQALFPWLRGKAWSETMIAILTK